jgi:hypothetical protein
MVKGLEREDARSGEFWPIAGGGSDQGGRRYHRSMTTKEQLHKLVDELSDQEAEAALVMVERRRHDPMLQALASAPLDDEASDADEDASAAEALSAYHRGEGLSSDQLRAELDLD